VQQVLTWLLSGLVVGWIVRVAMKTRRDGGLIGDLALGSIGALVGGWIFRRLGLMAPTDTLGHIVSSAFGAMSLLGFGRILRRLGHAAGIRPGSVASTTTLDLEAQIKRLGTLERAVFDAVLRRKPTAQDTSGVFDAQLTFGQRMADQVAAFGGSWTFISIFVSILVGWIILNDQLGVPFDPYPFILLNLVLSCLAALQAPVIMMSQNRQAAHDRLEARNDYQVNLRAEVEIMALHAKLDAARTDEIAMLVETQRRQLEVLQRLEGQLLSLASTRTPEM
jgi:uncharacterized membrane protein/uncharacterized membrane protein YeaQ/YmgE (transglycosylase-associated protein family)